MSLLDAPPPKPAPWFAQMRPGLVIAALMLAIPLLTRLAARFGVTDTADLRERALMALIAAFLVLTGNSIPKRIAARACAGVEPARAQSFRRFAGWTWVLTGLTLGLAWIALPVPAARDSTLVVVGTGMALVVLRWLSLLASGRRAA